MPYVEFHRWILAAVLAMARTGGAFAVCPALTESMIPGVARRAAVLGANFDAINPIGKTSTAGRAAAVILEEEPEDRT